MADCVAVARRFVELDDELGYRQADSDRALSELLKASLWITYEKTRSNMQAQESD